MHTGVPALINTIAEIDKKYDTGLTDEFIADIRASRQNARDQLEHEQSIERDAVRLTSRGMLTGQVLLGLIWVVGIAAAVIQADIAGSVIGGLVAATAVLAGPRFLQALRGGNSTPD